MYIASAIADVRSPLTDKLSEIWWGSDHEMSDGEGGRGDVLKIENLAKHVTVKDEDNCLLWHKYLQQTKWKGTPLEKKILQHNFIYEEELFLKIQGVFLVL